MVGHVHLRLVGAVDPADYASVIPAVGDSLILADMPQNFDDIPYSNSDDWHN